MQLGKGEGRGEGRATKRLLTVVASPLRGGLGRRIRLQHRRVGDVNKGTRKAGVEDHGLLGHRKLKRAVPISRENPVVERCPEKADPQDATAAAGMRQQHLEQMRAVQRQRVPRSRGYWCRRETFTVSCRRLEDHQSAFLGGRRGRNRRHFATRENFAVGGDRSWARACLLATCEEGQQRCRRGAGNVGGGGVKHVSKTQRTGKINLKLIRTECPAEARGGATVNQIASLPRYDDVLSGFHRFSSTPPVKTSEHLRANGRKSGGELEEHVKTSKNLRANGRKSGNRKQNNKLAKNDDTDEQHIGRRHRVVVSSPSSFT